MSDAFKAIIFVDDAYYDPKDQFLYLFATLKLTGEKKIISSHKSDWHYRDGSSGNFPDQEMHKLAKAFQGKTITWEMHSDPNLANATPQDMANMVHRIEEQINDMSQIASSETMTEQKRAEILKIQA